ncbi:MAG: argininosuccinate lyase [SAR202 cluster bacterium]|jgi:argininosuccinate lyase|nr:argininosuccinate lyase [Chloroflexota bacterium]MDP6419709.1 argininosuccinate lyase [SAR202 cluster bacterium]HAL46265.1 argininosuccinate lyase [Dehalococcoidia bacterium]MDP6663904.1 argininosuccinate lyase [SAR202 cluster bacterium]MDP6799339.1 argininosuccinate lyase [SAR202 cluster bacterium]|tara:strand:+ start:1580 stop:2935 length:1356 start_codon:yes stop_codon:yes gene_type:complete
MGLKEVSSDYTVSIHYDRRLYRQDIRGSTAHARMLARQGIIDGSEAEAIVDGLAQVRSEIERDEFPWRPELEDVHMNVERRLHEIIGEPALRLHTARSRNDQVALDMRMYVKDAIANLLEILGHVRGALVSLADDHRTVVMPGYTHLQRAQPVLFAHHMLAYFEMFGRDAARFDQARDRADVMPLGSGALAGLPYPLDRDWVAAELGFSRISTNSMDAVSDRDFLLDFHAAASICAMHLSRLAEELVIWSSDEFGFIRLSDDFTTGSSIMPQKRNPDFAEIARGKTGRVFGNLIALLTTLKGLPLTYNRDMQEDKEGFFDTEDTLTATLRVFAGMLGALKLNEGRMRDAAQSSYVLATDIADYLVSKGMPFRGAYRIVASLSDYAVERNKQFHDLSLDEFRTFSDLFDEGVLAISVDTSIDARAVPGGTGAARVGEAIDRAKQELEGRNGV